MLMELYASGSTNVDPNDDASPFVGDATNVEKPMRALEDPCAKQKNVEVGRVNYCNRFHEVKRGLSQHTIVGLNPNDSEGSRSSAAMWN